jgi:hypothetical protein
MDLKRIQMPFRLPDDFVHAIADVARTRPASATPGRALNRARRSLAWSTFTASRGAPALIRAEAMIVLLKLAI